MRKPFWIFIPLQLLSIEISAQETTWDNLFWYSNKVSWGNTEGDWKYSGELQFRFNNNMQNLDNYFAEVVAAYLASEKWEFQPDFRLSVYQDRVEYRPGLGVLYKIYPSTKFQIVNQVKAQLDIRNDGGIDQGYRYAVFVNYVKNKRVIPNLIGGVFYAHNQNGQSGIQFVRMGAGIAWGIDGTHFLNVAYFAGVDFFNEPNPWIGGVLVQLAINLKKDYKHLPGKIFSF